MPTKNRADLIKLIRSISNIEEHDILPYGAYAAMRQIYDLCDELLKMEEKMTEENDVPKESVVPPKSEVVEKPQEMNPVQLANFCMQKAYIILNAPKLKPWEYEFANNLMVFAARCVAESNMDCTCDEQSCEN